MAGHPDDEYNRDILDIIPERFDADPDSYPARSGLRLRNWLILGGAVLAVGVAVAVGLRMFAGSGGSPDGVPVISADQRPIKIRPDDRGGMQVPNQDKLVYGRLEQGDGDAKVERLLPQAEQPVPPPPTPPEAAKPVPHAQEVMKPAALPPPMAAPVAAPMPAPVPAPVAVKPVEPVAPPAPVASVVQTPPAQPVKTAPAKTTATPAAPAATVPAPAPVATSAAKNAAVSGGAFLVQLGALRSAPDAEKEWGRIQRANADVLGGLKSDVVQVDLGTKGVFWRLRAGPLDEQGARHVCGELKNRNQGCMVVRK